MRPAKLEAAHPAPAGAPAEPRWLVDILWLLIIIAVAVTVRFIYVFQYQSSPTFDDHDMDPLYHHQWAAAFARGESFVQGPYFRAPLYTWFLGTIYWLFGTASLPARLIQAALSALNCGLLFLIGRRMFNRRVGVLAGLLGAGYWLFVYYDAELLSPVLIVFLNLLLLWVLLETGDRRSPWPWLLSGFLLGLSAITRPDILMFAPLLAVWLFVLHWPRWRRSAGYALCLAAGCLLPILPITIRNYVVGQDRVLIASYGGVNFYIGNNPGADGLSAVIPGDPPEWWPCFFAQVERAERAEGRQLKPSEVSAWYARATRKYIASQPAEALGRMFKKLGYFWSRWEVSNNQDIQFTTATYGPVTRVLPVGFWLVGPLGFLGLLLSLRRSRALFPLWGMVLVYMLIAAAFFVTARYRIPAAVVLVLLAAYAVDWLVQALRARRWPAVGLAAVPLLGGAALVAQIPPAVDRLSVQGYRYAGFVLARQERYAEAETMLVESLAREKQSNFPRSAKAWNSLGKVRMNLAARAGGDTAKYEQARQALEQAVLIEPGFAEPHEHLATVYLTLRRIPEAIAQYQQLIQLEPQRSAHHTALGVALCTLGQPEEGVTLLNRAVELEPDQGRARAMLGATLISLGRLDEGLPHLLRGVELDSAEVETLVETAQRQKQPAESLRILRAGVERLPEEPRLLVRLAQALLACPDPALRDAPEAVRLAERAVRATDNKDPVSLYAAARAYWATARHDAAVAAARQALELARRAGTRYAPLIQVIERDLQRQTGP
ncbi:MAG: tetratricopeptide repeat protein [Planctomycetota bacterium]